MTDYIMNTYNRKDIAFKRGEGVYLWDSNDKKYLDVTCGLAVTSLGHSHPEISEVIYNQSKTLIHTTNAFVIWGPNADPTCVLQKRLRPT